MRSGGQMPVASFALPSDRPEGLAQTSGYKQAVVDVDPPSGFRTATAVKTRRPPRFSNHLISRLAPAGSAAQVETKTAGAAQFAGRDIGVRVQAPRYVVANLDTLAAGPTPVWESCAEAHDRLDAMPGDDSQVVLSHEAA
jgi:hypothetical protein